MSLNTSQVKAIAKTIYKKFPELSGADPTITRQAVPQAKSIGPQQPTTERYLLTFSTKTSLPNGQYINRIVRVVAGPHGKVIKISTSR